LVFYAFFHFCPFMQIFAPKAFSGYRIFQVLKLVF